MDQSSTADAKPRRSKRSPEEHRQLLTHHMSKLRVTQAEITELRAPLKEKQDEFTALVNEAKADLGKGYTRKHLVTLLEDSTTRLRNLLEEEERRARDREALGLPVYGLQADLFDGPDTAKLPDEVRDERFWEAQGFLLGREGKVNFIPDGAPPRFHQTIMRAAEKGNELTQADFVAGQELKKRMATPDAGAKPKDLNQHEPTEKERADAIKASEKLARESLGVPEGKANGKGRRLVADKATTKVVRTEPAAADKAREPATAH